MAATMTRTTTMKAVFIRAVGGPEVLQFGDLPRPEPGPNELQIRVYAAGVNPADWKIREGHLGKPTFPEIMGIDFSGVIETAGPGVRNFNPGEAVFGTVEDKSGSYAEYALTTVPRVARKPESLDHVHAAALPVASLTAWQALFDKANLAAKQRVLIHAAAGGVGGFAVQFAKWKGAHVIGTASSQSAAFVRELGADEVIDYRSAKFEEVARDVDVVFDTIGGDTQERSWRVLKRGGILVSVVQPPAEETAKTHGVQGVFLVCDQKRGDQLARIAELVVSGQVKVRVEKVLPLREARRAQELSQSGHAHGKIVLVTDAEPH
jgi:NADPH:quinone reductase-like Zn-dependent oxidoreductase